MTEVLPVGQRVRYTRKIDIWVPGKEISLLNKTGVIIRTRYFRDEPMGYYIKWDDAELNIDLNPNVWTYGIRNLEPLSMYDGSWL